MASLLHQRSLINDIAAATALDQPLTNLLLQRPYVVQCIVSQCIYTCRVITQLKSCCFGQLARGVVLGGGGGGSSTLHSGGGTAGGNATFGNNNIPLSTANTRTSSFGLHATAAGLTSAPAVATTSFSSFQVRDPICLVATPLQVHIVVIGCGSVGANIVEALIKTKVYHPSSICIVSRRPATSSHFAARGIRCYKRVSDAVGPETDIVLICVPPSQFPTVAKEIQQSGQLKQFATVMSVCCGISADKVASEVRHPIAMTTSIDVDALARAVTVWKQEEDAVAEHNREMYGATRKFAPNGGGLIDAAALSTDLNHSTPQPEDGYLMTIDDGNYGGEEETDEERRKSSYLRGATTPAGGAGGGVHSINSKQQLRHRQILHQAFPREVEVFFNRFFFNLVMACVARGVAVTDALIIVWAHLVPSGKQSFIGSQPPLNTPSPPFGTNNNMNSGGKSDGLTPEQHLAMAGTLPPGSPISPGKGGSIKGNKGPMVTHGRLAALCTVNHLANHLGSSNTRMVVEDFKGRFFELLSTTGTGNGTAPTHTTLK